MHNIPMLYIRNSNNIITIHSEKKKPYIIMYVI